MTAIDNTITEKKNSRHWVHYSNVKRFSTAINKKICKNFFVRELFYKGARPMPKVHHTCFSSSAGVSPPYLISALVPIEDIKDIE